MLTITQSLKHKIQKHLEAGYPNEACGILIGELDDDQNKILHDVVLVSNAWDTEDTKQSQHNRYLISPEDVARADREASKRNLDIIGFFHSHPDCPSVASETDREWAWPVVSFVIAAVYKGKMTTLQSWVLSDDRETFIEEDVTLKSKV